MDPTPAARCAESSLSLHFPLLFLLNFGGFTPIHWLLETRVLLLSGTVNSVNVCKGFGSSWLNLWVYALFDCWDSQSQLDGCLSFQL